MFSSSPIGQCTEFFPVRKMVGDFISFILRIRGKALTIMNIEVTMYDDFRKRRRLVDELKFVV